jgi:glutamate racemase
MHLLITDSGLGGLAVCAAAERALRQRRNQGDLRITYFNAWPEQQGGYNDMPDIASRARAFDRALAAMAALHPDRIVIACNTLSVVYAHTSFSRAPANPVLGIVDAGVDLFFHALTAHPRSSIALFGTRTTIESGVHRERLIEKGIAPERIATVACHGLARAIETDPDGDAVAGHIERCTTAAGDGAPPGDPLYFGVCCTHYTFVKDGMRSALERRCGRTVRALDPGDRLVEELVELPRVAADQQTGGLRGSTISPRPEPVEGRTTDYGLRASVTVVSKVEMDDRKRQSMARRVEAASPVTAAALLAYTRVPDLF